MVPVVAKLRSQFLGPLCLWQCFFTNLTILAISGDSEKSGDSCEYGDLREYGDAGESCDSIESCFFLVMLVIFN